MDSAKHNIRKIVATYTTQFKSEYLDFVDQMKTVRTMVDDFGSTLSPDGLVVRALYETPETLQGLLVHNLTEDQIGWLKSKEGGRWFATTFPVFAL